MDDAALLLDAAGRIECSNPVAQRWFGREALQGDARAWIGGLDCRDLAHGRALTAEENPILQLLDHGAASDAVLNVAARGLPWRAKLALQMRRLEPGGQILILWRDVTALHGPLA